MHISLARLGDMQSSHFCISGRSWPAVDMQNNSMALLHVYHPPVQTCGGGDILCFSISWSPQVLVPVTNPSLGSVPHYNPRRNISKQTPTWQMSTAAVSGGSRTRPQASPAPAVTGPFLCISYALPCWRETDAPMLPHPAAGSRVFLTYWTSIYFYPHARTCLLILE